MHSLPSESQDMYTSSEFRELDFDKDAAIAKFPDPRVIFDFLLRSEHFPLALITTLSAALGDYHELSNMRFYRSETQNLQNLRDNQTHRNFFLRQVHSEPNKHDMLRALLVFLYSHRQNMEIGSWTQGENTHAFEQEILRRRKAIIEVFTELYEYAYRTFNGERIPYVQKPIDLSGRPVEFPSQSYVMDKKIADIMMSAKVQSIAMMGAAMKHGSKIQPKLGPTDSFILTEEDGLNGLAPLDHPDDEIDFKNTFRIAAHILHAEGACRIATPIAKDLLPALLKKFPGQDPFHAFGTSLGMASHIPAMIQPSDDGILAKKISPDQFRSVVEKHIPEPERH